MNDLKKISDEIKRRFEKNSFLYFNWKGKKTEEIITLHEAKNIINQIFSEIDFKLNHEKYKDSPFGKLIASLQDEEQKEHKGGWIPCGERLPELETDVFICTKQNGIAIASLSKPDIFWTDEEGFHILDVIAWQPLPESYKGGVSK